MVAEYEGPYNKRFYDCVIVVILFTTLVQVAKNLSRLTLSLTLTN